MHRSVACFRPASRDEGLRPGRQALRCEKMICSKSNLPAPEEHDEGSVFWMEFEICKEELLDAVP